MIEKNNKYCYNKQSASGINPMEYNSCDSWLQVGKFPVFIFAQICCHLITETKTEKITKHAVNFISGQIYCKLLRNTQPKTAVLHAQCWKKSKSSSISLGIRWAFNSRPGYFCRGPDLAGLECSGCSGDRSKEWAGSLQKQRKLQFYQHKILNTTKNC